MVLGNTEHKIPIYDSNFIHGKGFTFCERQRPRPPTTLAGLGQALL